MKNLKIKIAFLFLFVFAIVLGAFSPVAQAGSTDVAMYGKTTPVLLNGINNAGTIWFQNDGGDV